MLLSATSSGVREMVAFNARGDVKCKPFATELIFSHLQLFRLILCIKFVIIAFFLCSIFELLNPSNALSETDRIMLY